MKVIEMGAGGWMMDDGIGISRFLLSEKITHRIHYASTHYLSLTSSNF
ncbi:hypothetical protein [Chryseobacterium piperi]|nr:hypothetical protein [Chryseobacterium piperi]